MKIAVIGAGKIGGTLGEKWARAGHAVVYGVRDVSSTKALSAAEAGGRRAVDTIPNAISFAEIVIFAVPGAAVEPIVSSQAGALNHKIVIDATNKVGAPEMSAIPLLAAQAPNARLFRAFHNLGWENFAEPVIGGVQADLFYCGQADEQARQQVEGLIQDIGLRPIYVGGLDQLPVVDNLTRLWFTLARGRNMGRRLAFKVLTP
jgi:predicted dinucleotide-binding enzyme